MTETTRERLDRHLVAVEIPGGTVAVKVARRGGTVVNVSPEFDECVRIAREQQRSVKEVQAAVMKAWLERRPGSYRGE